ncbi:uncharacterized protein LOC126604638 [Malus sylvestris]|uniref:uncharacterized protein LOC126604622 n=1 Tax=Malus sylvestris TaxID=3752 RepID=UPI0021AC37A0|nr:uncharacterized protein LOC126604622 [Malus sylvestris]XP_050127884.1 uncharacterized protein LOC126604638 [Malus sylvestris]
MEMTLKIFVLTTHTFYPCTPPGSSSKVPYRRGLLSLPILVAPCDGNQHRGEDTFYNTLENRTIRLLGTYKKSVRNKARPKCSIVEAHKAYESSTFCYVFM